MISEADTRSGNRYWRCLCDCGTEKQIQHSNLASGLIKSCGCYRRELAHKKNATHGHAKKDATSPEYRSWASMRWRCDNPRATGYSNYGGRGIRVCERWKSFENFLADMGPRPPGMSIERDDSNGDYTPSNCYWATATRQTRNRRTTVRVSQNGKLVKLCDIAPSHLPYRLVYQRIWQGWPLEKALSQPQRITKASPQPPR